MIEQYLQYIRRQNPVVDGAGAADPARNTISSAYEFALGQCGTDRASGEIWQDYIKFLQGPRVRIYSVIR
jgi:cleavage stimulation factor subunit 3